MKQNLIFLLVDQQQKACITDNQRCKTPYLDTLMAESICFENTHCVNAVCSPSRASLITGMLPHNHGMIDCAHTVPEYRAKYDQSLDTLPNALKEEGYHMAYYGKWHIERSFRLDKFGFDDYMTEKDLPKNNLTPIDKVIVKSNGYMDKTICGVYKEGVETTEEYFIYDKGIEFIERHRADENPFCVFMSTYAPHDPYAIPRDIYQMYDPDEILLPPSWDDNLSDRPNVYRRIRSVWQGMTKQDYQKTIACYYGYTTLVDMQIGRLVQYLKKNDLYDNTTIVYTTDHGDMAGAHGMFCKGVTPFEEVYHIPFTIKPGKTGVEPGLCDVHASTVDIAPTVLELLRLRPLKGHIDGESLLPYCHGRNGEDKISFAEFQGQRYAYTQRIVWKGHFKYVFNGFDYDEFYNLQDDPYELKNEIDNSDYQVHVHELAREMWNKIKETKDDCLLNAEYVMLRFAPVGPEKQEATGDFNIYNKPF